jgi:uncharacterized protein (TIRG00374 family)
MIKKLTPVISLFFFTFFYVSVLLWLDIESKYFDNFYDFASILLLLVTITAFSLFMRYLRWLWLLKANIKNSLDINYMFAYFSGFAYTASPGKIGELIRIRYFNKINISSLKVFSAFVFERLFDLIVVFILCLFAINDNNSVVFAFIFVLSVLLFIFFLATNTSFLPKLFPRFGYFNKLLVFIAKALGDLREWFNPLDILVSLTIGLISWSAISIAFVILASHLNINLPLYIIFSIYPLAMLVGAASMIPAGFGTTEATIIYLLSLYEVPFEISLIAAIGIRISTLWFSILIGIISIIILEIKFLCKNNYENT